ncbi:MAG TPA: ATP-binding protein, partial [Streptosporangiaceae bacterium]
LDEVRLAVGEACSRAVEVHQEHCPEEPVRVALTGSSGRFEVVVTNSGARDSDAGWRGSESAAAPGHDAGSGNGRPSVPAGTPDTASPAGAERTVSAGEEGFPPDLPPELGLAVIAGLADDVEVSRTEDGLSIRMSWPSGAPAG